jgi:xanthine dehydrogenase accessory factor
MISSDVAATEEPLDRALAWLDEGRKVALATVVETWGSSPRPRGSQLAIRDDGLFVGSVSGGCVEGKVVEAALSAMSDRAHRLLEFGVSNEEAWEVGLACGGTVHIYVEPVRSTEAGPLDRDVLLALQEAREARKAIVLLTPLDGGTVRTWSPGDPELPAELRDAVRRALTTDDATRVDTATGPMFVQALNPPLKLVVIGAVHIALPLTKMAVLCGYEVTVIDPRESFARVERWPDAGKNEPGGPRITVRAEWPDEVLASMNLDHRTAVVALTHDPKIDDLALEAALRSEAFYIGALGSGKNHAGRLKRLEASGGFSAGTLARVHGPVGLRIGARSPAEIAVSILGQMTESLRRMAS